MSVTMSFNFSDVKKFASKLKESVSSNVTSLLQNSNSGNNVSSSIKNGINGVIVVMDELQNWFSSNDSKNFPPEMLSVITQNRKNRRMVLCRVLKKL